MGFKIYEKEVELLARQMLLLHIALDTQVDLKERVELFLEVHGNLELTGKAEKAVDTADGDKYISNSFRTETPQGTD